MLNIKYGDKIYHFPQTFNEVTFKQFQDILKEDVDEIELVSILSGIPMDDLLALDVTEFAKLSDVCKLDFINEKPKLIIEIGGIKYGLQQHISKMSISEMKNYVELSKDLNTIYLMVALLYRPIISKKKKIYEIEPFNIESLYDRAEIFKGLSIDILSSIINYMLAINTACIEQINKQ